MLSMENAMAVKKILSVKFIEFFIKDIEYNRQI